MVKDSKEQMGRREADDATLHPSGKRLSIEMHGERGRRTIDSQFLVSQYNLH